MRNPRLFLCLLLAAVKTCAQLSYQDRAEALFRDLETVRCIDQEINDKLPVLFNYHGLGGYFVMPSARMATAGSTGFSYAHLPPYNLWSVSFQFFDHLETVGNYWVYQGVLDPTFGHLGFGDYAERAGHVKLCLLRPEDGFPYLPDFSLGLMDFFGSCRFNSYYAVATEELPNYNFEATLGWGHGRIDGFFGGVAWTPWRRANHFLKGLTLAAEYDANNYKHHWGEHEGGRQVRSRINAGAYYRLGKYFQATASTIRGTDWAAGLSLNYNLGESKGFFPKIADPPAYTAPVDREPIGRLRSGEEVARDLAFAFNEQGFDLFSVYLVPCGQGQDALWLKVVNVRYREEEIVRERIEKVLAGLSPSNISQVTAVVEADGVPVHEYRFRMCDLDRYHKGLLGENEFQIIAPIKEATGSPSSYEGALLYRKRKPVWLVTFRPRFLSYFGSSKGKFKGIGGFVFGAAGYLFDEIYYNALTSLTVLSMIQNLSSWDMMNPSKIINVRTDNTLYFQSASFHVEQAYLQKSWNLGQGWFTRLATGYFEIAYGGVSWEALYFPVQSNWAIGFEAAAVWKRHYYGLNFYNKIRKLTPAGFIWVPYTGLQYFVDFYYDYKPLSLDFKISAGQFLARDKGVRFDGGRTFPSGLRVGLWYTLTNANDVVNGSRYYDKGFSLTMPLDLFMNQTSRTRIGYGMSAWLRDCGAKAATGKELYHTIYYERYNPRPLFY